MLILWKSWKCLQKFDFLEEVTKVKFSWEVINRIIWAKLATKTHQSPYIHFSGKPKTDSRELALLWNWPVSWPCERPLLLALCVEHYCDSSTEFVLSLDTDSASPERIKRPSWLFRHERSPFNEGFFSPSRDAVPHTYTHRPRLPWYVHSPDADYL